MATKTKPNVKDIERLFSLWDSQDDEKAEEGFLKLRDIFTASKLKFVDWVNTLESGFSAQEMEQEYREHMTRNAELKRELANLQNEYAIRKKQI